MWQYKCEVMLGTAGISSQQRLENIYNRMDDKSVLELLRSGWMVSSGVL